MAPRGQLVFSSSLFLLINMPRKLASVLLSLLLLHKATARVVLGTAIFPSNAVIQGLKSNWTRLATVTAPARDHNVAAAIEAVTGVYRNRSQAAATGLQRTVLVSVVSLSDSHTAGAYLAILKNYLCYTAHYGHRPLVYYVTENAGSSSGDEGALAPMLADLQRHNPSARFAAYPDQLFWQVRMRASPLV